MEDMLPRETSTEPAIRGHPDRTFFARFKIKKVGRAELALLRRHSATGMHEGSALIVVTQPLAGPRKVSFGLVDRWRVGADVFAKSVTATRRFPVRSRENAVVDSSSSPEKTASEPGLVSPLSVVILLD